MSKKLAEKISAPMLGVATTTPIAFLWNNQLYLERMCMIAHDGCGVRTGVAIPVGTTLDVAFRLSTAKEMVRCQASVLGWVPTTPAGFRLRQKVGEDAFAKVIQNNVGDSATAMFRLEDLQEVGSSAPASPASKSRDAALRGSVGDGVCLRFEGLSKSAVEALHHHLTTSQRLRQTLLASGGAAVAAAEEGRLALASTFTEGDLSKRALDW